MIAARINIRSQTMLRPPVWLVAVMWLCQAARAAELQLPTLHTSRGTFTNVVITGRSDTDIYIRHDGGIGNVKLRDLKDDEALIALGLKKAPLKVAKPAPVAERTGTNSSSPGVVLGPYFDFSTVTKKWQEFKGHRELMLYLPAALGVLLVIFLFGSYCLKLICRKAGTEPGLLVWFPVLQAIPAFHAAGMSAWWFLALFLPLLNLVAHILWCFKIASARGKSAWVAIALLLPVFNLFAFLYLAFSDARGWRESRN